MGTLRWQSRLDQYIEQFSAQPFSKLDPEVVAALRLALYQLHYLDRIPSRAAVNESVELVKRARKISAAPFVNAVLRRAGKAANPADLVATAPSSAEDIASRLSHPRWMVERWVQHLGMEAAQGLCCYDQQVPETAVRITRSDDIAQLQASGAALAAGRILTSARIVRSGDITSAAAFREGRIAIQDEASQLVALLVGHGKNVLDCCAAPGGKTRILAERNPEARIVAAELHPHRARLLRKLVRNQNVMVLAADARSLPLHFQFDRVLLDAPCSGTGTLARNPDIKWRLRPEHLSDLQGRQLALLRSAMNQVAPGGRLVYATCSLEPEENETVVESALADRTDFQILECSEELQRLKDAGELAIEDLSSLTRGPYLRTTPGIHHCDGFFAAMLEKFAT